MGMNLISLPAGISYSRHTVSDDRDFHISSLQPYFLPRPRYSHIGRTLFNFVVIGAGVNQTLIETTADRIRNWLRRCGGCLQVSACQQGQA